MESCNIKFTEEELYLIRDSLRELVDLRSVDRGYWYLSPLLDEYDTKILYIVDYINTFINAKGYKKPNYITIFKED